MAPRKPVPARIHVLLARNARIGLVIRRGPFQSVATILWDRKTDKFTLGQWMRGRIYERRCDLSPDGKYFIYFAMNGRWKSETKGSWTAISLAPYLKAKVLFPKGDCWDGGGLFLDNRTYWLNDGEFGLHGSALLNSSPFIRDRAYSPPFYHGGECPAIYYPRLLRDGWLTGSRSHAGGKRGVTVFEKPAAKGWILQKLAHAEYPSDSPGKGAYWDEHQLENAESKTLLKFPNWEWADWADDHVVWATDGQLWSAKLKSSGLSRERMLHDFNGMKFEAIAAPYSY